jgi:hypothetical protein
MRARQPRPVNSSPAISTATHSFAVGQSIAISADASLTVVADQVDGSFPPASAWPAASTATHRCVVGHEMLVRICPGSAVVGLTECLDLGLNATASPRVSTATQIVTLGHERSSSL